MAELRDELEEQQDVSESAASELKNLRTENMLMQLASKSAMNMHAEVQQQLERQQASKSGAVDQDMDGVMQIPQHTSRKRGKRVQDEDTD